MNRISGAENSRATSETFGYAKISRAASVTEDVGLVLGASEKNPSVDGSLAKMIAELKNALGLPMIDTASYGGVVLFANSVGSARGFYPIVTGGGINSNNVPSGSYGYSTGFVLSRGVGTVIIVLFNRGDSGNDELAAVNANYGGSGWKGWKYIKAS